VWVRTATQLQFTIALTASGLTLHYPNDHSPDHTIFLFLWPYSVKMKSLFVLGETSITVTYRTTNRNKFRYCSVHSSLTVVTKADTASLFGTGQDPEDLHKKLLHTFCFSRTQQTARNTLHCVETKSCSCLWWEAIPQYKNCRRVATMVVVVALRGRRQQRSVTFATYLSLPRVWGNYTEPQADGFNTQSQSPPPRSVVLMSPAHADWVESVTCWTNRKACVGSHRL